MRRYFAWKNWFTCIYELLQIAFKVALIWITLSSSLPSSPSLLNMFLGCCFLFIEHEYSISVWNAVLVYYCAEPLWQEATPVCKTNISTSWYYTCKCAWASEKKCCAFEKHFFTVIFSPLSSFLTKCICEQQLQSWAWEWQRVQCTKCDLKREPLLQSEQFNS